MPGTFASLQLSSLARCQAWILEFLDLATQFLEMVQQAFHEQAKSTGQLVAGILDELRHARGDVTM